jgi:hypothetical protein
MASFVHLDYSVQHPGVVRAGTALDNLKTLAQRFEGTRGTAALLLAAVVAGVVTALSQVVDRWTDGHALAAWLVMWAIAFAALALLAAPLRTVAGGLKGAVAAWSAKRRQAAEDDKLWNLALTDARVMAELSRAMSADAAADIRRYY